MKASRRKANGRLASAFGSMGAPTSAAASVEAIICRQLLRATGSVENAVALLKAIET